MKWDIIKDILAAIGGIGGLSATGYWAWRSSRPKTQAEARKLDAEVTVTFADGWKGYAQKMEEMAVKQEAYARKIETNLMDLHIQFEELSKKFEIMKTEKETLVEANDEKDRRIQALEDKVEAQAVTITELQAEVAKYKSMDVSIQHVADVIHQKVDEVKTELSHSPETKL